MVKCKCGAIFKDKTEWLIHYSYHYPLIPTKSEREKARKAHKLIKLTYKNNEPNTNRTNPI